MEITERRVEDSCWISDRVDGMIWVVVDEKWRNRLWEL